MRSAKAAFAALLIASVFAAGCNRPAQGKPESVSREATGAAADSNAAPGKKSAPGSLLGTDSVPDVLTLLDTVEARLRRGDTVGLVKLILHIPLIAATSFPLPRLTTLPARRRSSSCWECIKPTARKDCAAFLTRSNGPIPSKQSYYARSTAFPFPVERSTRSAKAKAYVPLEPRLKPERRAGLRRLDNDLKPTCNKPEIRFSSLVRIAQARHGILGGVATRILRPSWKKGNRNELYQTTRPSRFGGMRWPHIRLFQGRPRQPIERRKRPQRSLTAISSSGRKRSRIANSTPA